MILNKYFKWNDFVICMSKKILLYYSLLFLVIICVFILVILSLNKEKNNEITYLEAQISLLKENIYEMNRLVEDRETRFLSIDDTNKYLSSELLILEKEHELALERIRLLESSSKHSPKNRISDSQITIANNRVIINIENPYTSTFSNTNSMLPLLSNTARAIQIIPISFEELLLGDVISYELNDRIVIHRIIELGFDEAGWYAITKGDNNIHVDPDKVRFEQVRRVLVAVIY